MTRRMSCSLTIEAVRERRKTVTRRHVDSWRDLKPGDRLTLVEKGMGLPKGAKQVVLAEVKIVDVAEEPLRNVCRPGECEAEGFPRMNGFDFMRMWAKSHGMIRVAEPSTIIVRRIEWVYLCPLCHGTEWYVDEFNAEQACHKCFDGTIPTTHFTCSTPQPA